MRLSAVARALFLALLAVSCGRTDRIRTLSDVRVFELQAAALPEGRVGIPYDAGVSLVAVPAAAQVNWFVAQGTLPPGLSLLPEGVTGARLAGTPQVGGLYSFTLQVTDDSGRVAQQDYAMSVALDDPLEVTTRALPDGVVGVPYQGLVEARGGSMPYQWSSPAGDLPDGLAFGTDVEGRGELLGVPVMPGEYRFDLQVEDALGGLATREFSVLIRESQDELRIVTNELAVVSARVFYVASLEAAGGQPPYLWEAFGLPDGLSVGQNGSAQASIEGLAQTPGLFPITVFVSDALQAGATRDFLLEVRSEGPVLRILTNTLASGRVAEPYSQTVLAEGGAPPYRWRVRDGALPQGLTMDISGTPATNVGGTPQRVQTARFEVEVEDQLGAIARRPFMVTIEEAIPPLRVVTPSLPDGTEGRPYEVPVRAEGGVPPYSWSIVNGTLPAGLTIGGVGTPQTLIAGQLMASGVFTFDVLVTDVDNRTARRTFTIDIAGAPTPPVILTGTLGNARRCEGYSQPLQVSGGFPPLTWSITAGSLPTGLTLDPMGSPNSTITGYPDATGSFSVTVQVQDSLGQVDTQMLTLQVVDVTGPSRWVTLVGRFQSANRDVYVSNVCGATPSAAVRASTGSGRIFSNFVAMSPSGDKLAYIGDFIRSSVQELFVVDLRGATPGTPVRVHPPGNFGRDVRNFAFSPDGRWLAFVGDLTVDGRTEVWVADVSNPAMPGTARVVSSVPTASPASVFELAWSSDSRRLAYRGSLEQAGRSDVYLTSTTSTVGHVRINNPAGTDSDVFDIVWSPTGAGIAFVADEDLDSRLDLFWVAIGNEGRPAAPVRLSSLPDNGDVRSNRVAFSANGDHVAYTATQNPPADEIFAVSLAGATPGPQVRLNPAFSATRDVFGFSWAPAGAKLVYAADQDQENVTELYLVDASAAAPAAPAKVNLPLNNTSDVRIGPTNLGWSPDGNWVAFLVNSVTSGPIEAYTSDVRGPVPITRPVGPPRTDARLDVRALTMSRHTNHLAVVGELLTVGVRELFFVDLTGSVPTMPVRVNPNLVNGGDVSFSVDSVAFRTDGSGVFYIADQVSDFVNEAWSVPLLGGPGASTRMHAPLPSGRRVERILVP